MSNPWENEPIRGASMMNVLTFVIYGRNADLLLVTEAANAAVDSDLMPNGN